MSKYSRNRKLNNVLTEIEGQLFSKLDVSEIKRYMNKCPKETDEYMYQCGNLLVFIGDIRQMYLNAGYKCERWSDDRIEQTYMRQVGYVARMIITN